MTAIVVSAGTYHLPFHRLTQWIGQWYAHHQEVDLMVQHGPSQPVPGARNCDVLPYEDLLEHCEKADAVVLQGGAGGVMDMNKLGVIPIVVPRVPVDDEVVDDHQLIFTAEMQRLGLVHRATDQPGLEGLLSRVLEGDLRTRTDQPVQTPGIAACQALTMPPPRLRISTTLGRFGSTLTSVLRRHT